MSGKPNSFSFINFHASLLLLILLAWAANASAWPSGKPLPGDTESFICPSQKDFSVPLALGDAVDLGLCNNPQIKEAWAKVKIQAGAVGEAKAAYMPALNASISYYNDKLVYPGSDISGSTVNNSTISGSLTWRLLDFGGRGANHQAQNNLLKAAFLNHDYIIQKSLADLIQAYFDAVTAKAVWKAKTQSKEIARGTLEVAVRREAKGTVARSDTLQAATALAKASLEENRAQGAYYKAVAVLLYSMGVPIQTQILLPDDLGEITGQEFTSLEALMADVQKNHPAIKASREQLKAARNQVSVAWSDGLPSLDFSLNYYQNGRPGQSLTLSSSDETIAGVTLNIPVFDGLARFYKIREAKAQVEQKQAALQDVEHQTLMDLVKAHADSTSALQNLQEAAALVKAATESLAVSQRKYEKGAADILEILNTQSALADAQMENIRCRTEWNSARLRLLASAGKLGREAVSK
jgi:outer membrane protein